VTLARTPLLVAAALLASLATSAALTPLAGQQDVQEEPVDSARIRAFERLRTLARPPGYDSLLYTQDSVRLAEAALGNRPGSGTSTDSVAQALLSLPGYILTEYQGASADFRTLERVLVLTAPENGRASVSQEGIRAEGDTSVTFDQSTGILRVLGNPSFSNPSGEPIDAATMVYDLAQARGSATGARTSINEGGANWIVTGDMPYAAQDSSFMSHARFTSCEIDEPHYHFEADQVKMVGGRTLIARGVRLYFGDVPVFWLPFIAQNLDSERSSGVLRPRFSVNDIVRTSTGYRRRVSNVGFYWAMSDYSDALMALDWFSDTFWSLTGSTQYRFNRRFLQGTLNFRQYWRQDGSTERAIDTNHAWQIDERTDLRISGRYATSNDFVRENSFNPREVTQSIDSEGGLSRRFDWGQVSVSANRRAYLSDDRTEWTLPSANLSLSPITLFRAPSAEASFWNNMTWSGSSNVQRRTLDRMVPDTFAYSLASTVNSTAFVRSNLSMGPLTFGQSVNVTEAETLGVPEALLLLGDSASGADLLTSAPARNIAQSNLNWSMSLGYQQQLVGSTTITPRLGLSGRMQRADTSSFAQDFVSAPMRVAFGAQLKTDIYGFFPGVGPFEMIRHKFSPSINYQWSPESTPNDLQRDVFGSLVLQPQNAISLTLNQTFEAKRTEDEETRAAADSAAAAQPTGTAGEPSRVPQAQIVSLLALRTSVVRYDFVQADSAGSFIHGFETTRLSNQLSSDLLRGLSVSMDHDLFEDEAAEDGSIAERRFAPHLAQLNLGFSLGSSSGLFRWISSLWGGEAVEEAASLEPGGDEVDDPFNVGDPTDESSIIPTGAQPGRITQARRAGSRGSWTTNVSYSLQRPRDPALDSRQMLTGSIRLQPTAMWGLSWRTAYDIEKGAFNDHSIRLTRDLHRWQANFDFLQTATGNWSFRFEVSLMDNRDLKFDYDQQNLDLGLPAEERES
jgi:hypothetical protein